MMSIIGRQPVMWIDQRRSSLIDLSLRYKPEAGAGTGSSAGPRLRRRAVGRVTNAVGRPALEAELTTHNPLPGGRNGHIRLGVRRTRPRLAACHIRVDEGYREPGH
jgi:hypothetical protein